MMSASEAPVQQVQRASNQSTPRQSSRLEHSEQQAPCDAHCSVCTPWSCQQRGQQPYKPPQHCHPQLQGCCGSTQHPI